MAAVGTQELAGEGAGKRRGVGESSVSKLTVAIPTPEEKITSVIWFHMQKDDSGRGRRS